MNVSGLEHQHDVNIESAGREERVYTNRSPVIYAEH